MKYIFVLLNSIFGCLLATCFSQNNASDTLPDLFTLLPGGMKRVNISALKASQLLMCPMNSTYGVKMFCRRKKTSKIVRNFKIDKRSYSAGVTAGSEKQFIFVRHGTTEMNERLITMPWYSDKFVDAALWDTRLSSQGVQQAQEVHKHLITEGEAKFNLSQVQLLLASPLTRALHTAQLVFGHQEPLLPANVRRVSHPLLRERLYLSSEVGRAGNELQLEFPQWDFAAVPSDVPWWYTHPTSANAGCRMSAESAKNCSNSAAAEVNDDIQSARSTLRNSGSNVSSIQESGSDSSAAHAANNVSKSSYQQHHHQQQQLQFHQEYIEWRPAGRYCCEGEPNEEFTARVLELRRWLLSRPERCIAVVTHWGVLKALTGVEFKNCEVKVVKASELLEVPVVTDT